jgi:hypothetical protein
MAARQDTQFFYRSFLKHPDFPFNFILGENSEIEINFTAFHRDQANEIWLDDAFVYTHYNMGTGGSIRRQAYGPE